jgi:ABC-2 type transport system permease protein
VNWRAVLAIAHKDVVDAVKNLYILFALVMPIGVSLLLGLIFSDTEELGALTIAVYDQGQSGLVQEFRDSPVVALVEVDSQEDLRAEVEGEAVGGLVLPAGFDAAVTDGQRPQLTVYLNGQRGEVLREGFQRFVERRLWTLAGYELPVEIVSIDVSQPEGTQGQTEAIFPMGDYLLCLVLVMGLSMTGCFVVPLLLVEEREKHTLEALLMSPVGTAEVVAGKALTGLTYSFLMAGILIAMNRGWEGDWPYTILIVLLGALFAVAAGLLMGSVFRTTNQVNTWSSIIMLALMVPSWFVLIRPPAALELLLRLVPTHYMVQALELSLAGQASLARVWTDLAVLAGGTVALLAVVTWLLRREQV